MWDKAAPRSECSSAVNGAFQDRDDLGLEPGDLGDRVTHALCTPVGGFGDPLAVVACDGESIVVNVAASGFAQLAQRRDRRVRSTFAGLFVCNRNLYLLSSRFPYQSRSKPAQMSDDRRPERQQGPLGRRQHTKPVGSTLDRPVCERLLAWARAPGALRHGD
jgi:hypothetical protein